MIISKRFRRPISFFLSICLVFQTFVPALVYAADDATASASLETQAKPDLAPPDITPTPTESPSVTPSTTPIPIPTPTPNLSPTPPLDPSTGFNPEVANVGEGIDYRYKDTNVVVRFTKVTKPGKLTIRQIKLTPEQMATTGALSDTAYDITSDMENGTFSYDLTLPLPKSDPDAKVEFASDQNSLDQSVVINTNVIKNSDTIEIKGLDHFTIFMVTGGADQATNGDMCGVLYDCSIDANPPSLEDVDTNYLDINSFDETTSAIWPDGDFSADRYVQFNFSPSLDTDLSIDNSRLKIVYKTNQIDGSLNFGAKIIVSEDSEFDEDTDFITTSITPDATKPDTDQSFTIDLPEEYLAVDTLNNLKIRFYFFADPLAEDVSGVTTSFNQIILDVNHDPVLPTISVLGEDPVVVEINSTYTDAGSTAVDGDGTDITSQIVVDDSDVDTSQIGSYTVYFDVDDSNGNSAIQETRTVNVVDSIANAFAIISANLAASGSDIANNLNLVNTNNVGSFSGLYFEKSIDGTPVGKLTFTKALNLSDSATQTFLQNLGSKLDQANGRIALNATESGVFVSTGATLEMYDIMVSVTSSNLVVRDDSGTALDPLGIISGFTYDSEANKVIFDTAHFTQFDIDTTAPTKPTATPAAGDYTSDQSVTLESSDSLSGLDKIYYTMDGSTPDKTKIEYAGAISVDRDMTIKAVAYDKAGNVSDVLEAVYGIAPKTSTSGGIGGSGASDGKSVAPSAPVCNNTKPGSAPTLLSAFGGVNNVTLKWTEAADPLTYYLVTYGTKPGAQTYGNPNIGGKGTTGYTVSGLSGGITYYFQVRAGNGCAPGDFSNEISAAALGSAIPIETPAEGFAPGVKGASTDLTPTPTPSIPGETNQNNFPWWFIVLLIATGGFGARLFFRRQ